MSLFHPLNLICPNCQAAISMPAVGSVNADRRPDLRQSILDDNFQDTTCGSCGQGFRLPPQFNYLHVAQGQWIAAMPALRMAEYLSVEDDVLEVFNAAYGTGAPASARDIGKDLTVRLTFGWPAVREKILARASGLDDVTLEIVKLEMLRSMTDAPMGPGIELRLVQDLGADLAFAWLEGTSEGSAGDQFALSRHVYDTVASQTEAYAPLRETLTSGPFVDMQKLYMGKGRGAPPPAEPDLDAILAEVDE